MFSLNLGILSVFLSAQLQIVLTSSEYIKPFSWDLPTFCGVNSVTDLASGVLITKEYFATM